MALRAFLISVLMLGLAACGGEEDPEAQIRAFVAAGEAAVEAGSIKQSAELVHADYRDDYGNDKRRLVRLLLGYLHGHRNIHLLTRIDTLSLAEDGESAAMVLYAGMAAEPVESFDALFSLRADVYRFDLQLRRTEDGWRLARAAWGRAGRNDLPN